MLNLWINYTIIYELVVKIKTKQRNLRVWFFEYLALRNKIERGLYMEPKSSAALLAADLIRAQQNSNFSVYGLATASRNTSLCCFQVFYTIFEFKQQSSMWTSREKSGRRRPGPTYSSAQSVAASCFHKLARETRRRVRS